ncbi:MULTISPECIES: hypothetical protein [Acinetobacter]|uniref:hypothetical protein n=1 Tax=Acinetobacter TaxID=469 RepID=UPI000CEC8C5E|nr:MULTISPECIES: hypothetical protein [Acinetobacter]HEN9570765.1 hypothetical protein [Acinetobacter baumannii]HEN9600993.1 hypothetical protein [Acinetobacter baumannii]
MQNTTDQIVSEIVLNILQENDGTFDLSTPSGINQVSEYAADYYKVAGVDVTAAQIKRELTRQIKAFKEPDLM